MQPRVAQLQNIKTRTARAHANIPNHHAIMVRTCCEICNYQKGARRNCNSADKHQKQEQNHARYIIETRQKKHACVARSHWTNSQYSTRNALQHWHFSKIRTIKQTYHSKTSNYTTRQTPERPRQQIQKTIRPGTPPEKSPNTNW